MWRNSGRGPRLGSNLPLRGQKAQMYEGGIRTPALINWPFVLGPRKLTRPIHMVDWMPTFCQLVGHTPESDRSGTAWTSGPG